MHIVAYTCEQCGERHSRPAGSECDGMCSACGFPMRIADLFSDRRIVTIPVHRERREIRTDRAA